MRRAAMFWRRWRRLARAQLRGSELAGLWRWPGGLTDSRQHPGSVRLDGGGVVVDCHHNLFAARGGPTSIVRKQCVRRLIRQDSGVLLELPEVRIVCLLQVCTAEASREGGVEAKGGRGEDGSAGTGWCQHWSLVTSV
jgi:hypothetical protein